MDVDHWYLVASDSEWPGSDIRRSASNPPLISLPGRPFDRRSLRRCVAEGTDPQLGIFSEAKEPSTVFRVGDTGRVVAVLQSGCGAAPVRRAEESITEIFVSVRNLADHDSPRILEDQDLNERREDASLEDARPHLYDGFEFASSACECDRCALVQGKSCLDERFSFNTQDFHQRSSDDAVLEAVETFLYVV